METIAEVRFWRFLDDFVKIQCLTQIHILLRVGDLRQTLKIDKSAKKRQTGLLQLSLWRLCPPNL